MDSNSVNPRTAGGLSHLCTAGGADDPGRMGGWADDPPPPIENSKTKKDSDKR